MKCGFRGEEPGNLCVDETVTRWVAFRLYENRVKEGSNRNGNSSKEHGNIRGRKTSFSRTKPLEPLKR